MTTSLPFKARGVAATLLEHVPAPAARALAEPPPGSGLEPVMGEPGPPVVGQTLLFLKDNIGYARRNYERYGTVFWSNSLGTQVVSVLGPEGIETVLTNRDQAFSNALGCGYFIGPFFERGVMLMDFEEHRHHRRIMQQAFKRDRLVAYIYKANTTIARVLRTWRQGPGFTLYDAAKQLTLDVATEVFVGTDIGAGADRINRAFIDTVVGGQAIIRADVRGGKWHRGLQSRRVLQDYFRSQIPEKRAGEGDDLFSVLCHAETEDGERFSDDDIVNHMIFTMMAAHDTSTITVAMMGYYLARHPEWQERLREESVALATPAIGYAEADAPPSLDLALRETLRLNAPVGMVARQAIRDTALAGRFVPRGANLMLGIYATQRLEPW